LNSHRVRSAARRHGSEAKRRLRSLTHKVQGGDGCQICGAPRSPYEPIAFAGKPDLVRRMSRCSGCGYVAIEELSGDRYRSKTSLDQLPEAKRIGTVGKPGREFLMARMAIDILKRSDLEVLVYGVGRSLDNVHIGAMRRVRNVAISDIMRVRDDAEFHDANRPAAKRFPVVIASEVIEHFRSPHEDFAELFGFVAKDGILVCGTNIYGGGDLSRDRYPFWPDHTSYYTPEALLEIAETNGFYLDFRTPRRAGANGRKRYVIFTKSQPVLQNVSLYFGRRAVAPSD